MKSNPFAAIYEKINRMDTARDPMPAFPLLVDVEVTNRCNLSCIMCEHTYMQRKQQPMREEIFKKIIDQCKPYKPGIRLILFSEPFLHPGIISLCRYVKEAGLLLHVTNNGTVITEKHIDALISMGLDSITFSLQGLTDAEYYVIRANKCLSRVKKRIEYIFNNRKNGPFIQVSTTISERDSLKDIDMFKKRWGLCADIVTVGKTNWTRIAEKDPAVINRLGISSNNIRAFQQYLPCLDIESKLAVLSNGNITVCCNDPEGKLALGNIENDDLSKVWNSDIRAALHVLLRHMRMDMFDVCRTCYPAYDLKKQTCASNIDHTFQH